MNNDLDQCYENPGRGAFLMQWIDGISRVDFIRFGVGCMVKEVGESD